MQYTTNEERREFARELKKHAWKEAKGITDAKKSVTGFSPEVS